ncbi:MAG: hypothetical protein IPP99_04125, partial [Chitinophagaceae bacterium]|nr:hypothetical protein [Chitinophagaceae bacterium]
IQVKQTDAGGYLITPSFFPANHLRKKSAGQVRLNWKHQENEFLDYNNQYLIPPAIDPRTQNSSGRLNGDGLDDFYLCAAAGQSGQLMIQNSSGGFQTDSIPFNKAKSQ